MIQTRNIAGNEHDYEISRMKGMMVKNLLQLARGAAKKLRQSSVNWTYNFSLSVLKNVFTGTFCCS